MVFINLGFQWVLEWVMVLDGEADGTIFTTLGDLIIGE
jgi:hypothetical protein